MFFAGLTQNKIAAKRANIFNHAKFQLGLVAGCSEKYIRTNIIVPAAPAIPKSMVSNIRGILVLFNLYIWFILTKIVSNSKNKAATKGVKNVFLPGLLRSALCSNKISVLPTRLLLAESLL